MANQYNNTIPHEEFGRCNSKDFAEHNERIDDQLDSDAALQRIRTAGSISISPELFEKIYLSPQNQVKGELRKTFGNPTPLALVGFLLSLTPLSCDLMGWRGANVGNGSADIGAYFFFGGLLMILGAIGEWLIGNTFPFVVFGSFGAFWLTFACVLDPTYGSISNYTTATTTGADTPAFNSAFGFFCIWMGVLCFVYMICALRTNVVFFLIFFTLVLAFGFLTAAYWYGAKGYTAYSAKMLVGGGACAFVTCLLGWWIFFAILLAALDFPFQLPVGDLSTFIKGASEKIAEREKEKV